MLRTHHAEHRSPHRHIGSHKVHVRPREETRAPKRDPDPGRRDDQDAPQRLAYRGFDAYDHVSYGYAVGHANDKCSTATYVDERDETNGVEESEIDDLDIDAFSPS